MVAMDPLGSLTIIARTLFKNEKSFFWKAYMIISSCIKCERFQCDIKRNSANDTCIGARLSSEMVNTMISEIWRLMKKSQTVKVYLNIHTNNSHSKNN